jgi:hypothetical protein
LSAGKTLWQVFSLFNQLFNRSILPLVNAFIEFSSLPLTNRLVLSANYLMFSPGMTLDISFILIKSNMGSNTEL